MSHVVTVTEQVNDVTVTSNTYTVTVTNGAAFTANLNDLVDVDTSGVANGEFLAYVAATSTWEPTGSSATVNSLDDIGDVVITSPADGAVLTYQSSTSTWIDAAAASATPGGLNTQVQYNNAGAFAGDAGLTYNDATDTLTIAGGLVVDSTTLVVDEANNRVGIGTATPGSIIHAILGSGGTANLEVGTSNASGYLEFTEDSAAANHGARFHLDGNNNNLVLQSKLGGVYTNSLYLRYAGTEFGNIGIGAAPVTTGLLTLTSTTKGFLPPRMTTTEKNAISSPAEGLVVFDTDLNALCVYAGTAWVNIYSDDGAGVTTLANIDALDATTEATIEAAVDTLANLTSIQGRTVTLADAGADAVFGWDDSANAYVNLTAGDARTALGLVAGGTGDIWVEKAGDTMTGALNIAPGSSTNTTYLDVTGAQTQTASGSTTFTNFSQTISPASNSSNDFRALSMSNRGSVASGVTLSQVQGARIEGLRAGSTQDGLVSSARGVKAVGVLMDSNSVASGFQATSAIGVEAIGLSRPSGTGTGTITTVYGVSAKVAESGQFTITNAYGVQVGDEAGSNVITNQVGVEVDSQTQGTALNIGIRVDPPSGASNNYAIQLTDSGGTSAGGITFSTDTNLYRSAASTLKTDDAFISDTHTLLSDDAYSSSWNGSLGVPTKNALYDKIESISAGSLADGDYGDITVSSSGTVFSIDAATVGVTELSASGTASSSTFLRGDNTWATPAGSGDVVTVGTPVDGQLGVWTGAGTLEGDSALTFDTTTDSLVIAASGNLLFGAVTILDDAAGTMTLSNIDALDATTEATIEAAIDTLANLTSIQGRTVTLADAGADAFLAWDDSASAYQNISQADARTILGLGTAAYVATDLADLNEATIEAAIDTLANLTSIQGQSVTFSGTATLSGTNTGDQTIALTGDVTGSGTGSFAATIANNAVTTAKILDANVTLAKMADIATNSILGRATAATGVPEVLTALPFADTGDVSRSADSTSTTLAANYKIRTLTAVIDGGGSAITTGAKKAYIQVPYSGTITEWTLLADQTGSIVIDVWKDTYANYPPTVADTITASAKPTITTATKNTSTTLTGWTTSVTAGDIIEFNVDSVTSITKCHVFIKMTVTA